MGPGRQIPKVPGIWAGCVARALGSGTAGQRSPCEGEGPGMVAHVCLQKGPSTLLSPEGPYSRQGVLRAVADDSGARWA